MCQPHLIRKASVKLSLVEVLFNSSTIHGVKYIADYHSPRATRTFWICAFFLSILGCIFYAHQVYDKWYVTPDIGLKTDFKSSRIVPFPAITVCPQNKVKRTFFNYGKAYNETIHGNYSGSEEERRYFEMALQVCTSDALKFSTDASLKNKAFLNGEEITELMSESQYRTNETFIVVRFLNNYDFGLVNVSRVLTSDGFCTTFNLEDQETIFKENSELSEDFDSYKNNKTSEWTPLSGYNLDSSKDAYPNRIFSGNKNSLVMLLVQSKNDEDAACLGPDVGFKVYWHMPNEIPSRWHRYVMVGPEKSNKLIMKATRVTTSKDLERYEPAQRRCYFDDEKKLKFFKSYTKSHCDLECLTKFTLKVCGCVRFFMPRDKKTPVCNVTNILCAEQAEDDWLEQDEYYQKNKMPCQCYPSCAVVKYEVLMNEKNDYDSSATLKMFGDEEEFYKDYPGGQISRLTIMFEDFLIEDQENYLGYKMQHFISDCGGLLGLFMGCSILSLVELVYNFVLTFLLTKNTLEDNPNSNKPLTPMKNNRTIVVMDEMDEDEIKKDE